MSNIISNQSTFVVLSTEEDSEFCTIWMEGKGKTAEHQREYPLPQQSFRRLNLNFLFIINFKITKFI